MEAVKFLWKRKHFDEKDWKRTQKRLILSGSGSKKFQRWGSGSELDSIKLQQELEVEALKIWLLPHPCCKLSIVPGHVGFPEDRLTDFLDKTGASLFTLMVPSSLSSALAKILLTQPLMEGNVSLSLLSYWRNCRCPAPYAANFSIFAAMVTAPSAEV